MGVEASVSSYQETVAMRHTAHQGDGAKSGACLPPNFGALIFKRSLSDGIPKRSTEHVD